MRPAPFLAILFFLHFSRLSIRCQRCIANTFGPLKSCVERLLAAPDTQLNSTFGWKIRLSLGPQQTFHVKLFTLFCQKRRNFILFFSRNFLNLTGLPEIHGANTEATVDFKDAKIDRVKPKVK